MSTSPENNEMATGAATPEDFGYTAEHGLLRTTARRLLADKCPLTRVRSLVDDPVGFDPALHRELAELGWVGLLAPEDCGGAGMDLLSMVIVLEECGRCLLPGPFFSTVLAAKAIELAAAPQQRKRLLPDVLAGKSTAAIALSEPEGGFEPERVRATAERTEMDGAPGYRLDGVKTHVLWARQAEWMVAAFALAGEAGRPGLFAVGLDSPGVRVEPEVGVDMTRRMARVTLDGVVVTEAARLAAGTAAIWNEIHRFGWVLIAAEMLGAAQAVLAKTRDYAAERVQFGRPIGSFQAVKHPLVNLLISLENSRSLVMGAAAAVEAGSDGAERLAHMAKAACTETLGFAVDRGVQLHGGFGFTWDCDVHFYFKRSLWSAATLGDVGYHRRELAARLLD